MKKELNFNKENIFYKNRMRIKEISEKENCDAGVASSMYANEAGIKNTDAMDEWQNIMRAYQQDPKLTLADLFK